VGTAAAYVRVLADGHAYPIGAALPKGVYGSKNATLLVYFIHTDEREREVRDALQARAPIPERDESCAPLSGEGWKHLIEDDPGAAAEFYRLTTDFRSWLNVWEHLNGETGKRQILGHNLWDGQSRFVDAFTEHKQVISLKSRKVGLTAVECAYDGFVLRTLPESFVSAVSYRQQASNSIRKQVLEGLQALPSWLALPVKHTTTSVTVEGGGHLEAFPATERTAVDRSATHVHLDELARCIAPEDLWQAIQPSVAGTLHCLSASLGPENFMSTLWRRSELGDTRLHPVFVSALERPDRDEQWYAAMQKDLGPGRARLEYPLTPEDALAGFGDKFFPEEDLLHASEDFYPLQPYCEKHRYTAGVDVGVNDAFCIVVLDHTGPVYDVAHFVHQTGLTYPQMAYEIEKVYRDYPGVQVVIEENSAGAALRQMLSCPSHGHYTSARSKQEMLFELQARLARWELKIDPAAERIYHELRGYMIPDKNVVQDAVMALSIANYNVTRLQAQLGRVLGVISL
jgi:hypothetical protein